MIRKNGSFVTVLVGSGLALCLSAPPSSAQGTPWLAEPGTGTVNISFVNQNATEFYRQTTKVKGPLEATGANLAQNTMWFGVNYAVNDAVAIDVQSAWARSLVAGGVGPSGGQESYSGIFDSTVAVTWRMVDELISGEGFSPSRFPGLQEDAHIVGGRLMADVTDNVSLNGFVGRVVAGRNTAASLLISFGVSLGFGGGGVGF